MGSIRRMAGRRLALRWRIALLVIGPLVVLLTVLGLYLVSAERQARQADLLAKGRILATTGAQSVSSVLDNAIASGQITPEQLFDTTYVPIPGTQPQKYHTAYDAFTDSVLQKFEDQFQSDPDVVFAIAVDRNGYVPTHNTSYSNPSAAPTLYRTKQLFNDPTGLAAAQSQAFQQQTYKRDTGETMWDLDAPITVQGQHWGAFRVGFSINHVEAELADTTRTITLALLGVLVLLAAIVVLVADRIAAPIRRIARAAKAVAVGELDQHVAVTSNDEVGDLAVAFESMISYQQRMATVADAVAKGDLSVSVTPASERDALGHSFVKMIGDLRSLVGELQRAQIGCAGEHVGGPRQGSRPDESGGHAGLNRGAGRGDRCAHLQWQRSRNQRRDGPARPGDRRHRTRRV